MVKNVDFGRIHQIGTIRMKWMPCTNHWELWAHTWCSIKVWTRRIAEHKIFEIPRISSEISGKVPQNLSLKWSKKRRFWSVLRGFRHFSGGFVGVRTFSFGIIQCSHIFRPFHPFLGYYSKKVRKTLKQSVNHSKRSDFSENEKDAQGNLLRGKGYFLCF